MRRAACLPCLGAANAFAQGRITGTVYDSLSARAPLASATVVLVETSRYTTTDARGRFRFDSVPARRDIETGVVSATCATSTTYATGVYVLCGIPRAVNLEVYSDLAGSSAGPSELSIDDRLIGRRDFAISRRDGRGQPLSDAVLSLDRQAQYLRRPHASVRRTECLCANRHDPQCGNLLVVRDHSTALRPLQFDDVRIDRQLDALTGE